ncbi:hypothetical protein H4219_005203 [Mycoemilia scoparia]|uniref:Uncharacterized protein n=1 Tax=Mycoemilia scoparia TaxID=417184 RepID=A0A9W8DKA1_9FUNG|nr:hypothetical protein H4219_005203 [Mycoemilia scoparia]
MIFDTSQPDTPILYRLEKAAIDIKNSNAFTDIAEKEVFAILMRYGNIDINKPLVPELYETSKEPDMNVEEDKEDGANAIDTDTAMASYREKEEKLQYSGGVFDIYFGIVMFLSLRSLKLHPLNDVSQFNVAPKVTEYWLRYLLDNNVCPEIDDDEILKSLAVVERSKIEFINVRKLSKRLPGKFNEACSMLYGGTLKAIGDLQQSELDKDGSGNASDLNWAPKSTVSLITLAESKELCSQLITEGVTHVKKESVDIRVEQILENDSQIVCHRWIRESTQPTGEPFRLVLDPDVIKYVCPGFYIEVDLHTLSNGMCYIDQVSGVWPSYTLLEDIII